MATPDEKVEGFRLSDARFQCIVEAIDPITEAVIATLSSVSLWLQLRYRARACAFCAHFASAPAHHCTLDGEAIDLMHGTCGAWVLDKETVFTFTSAHEKAEAIALKQATYVSHNPETQQLDDPKGAPR